MPFITQNPTLDLVSEQQPCIWYLDDGTAIFKGVGTPEGVVFAGPGSIFVNGSGQAYLKTTGTTLNTGWQQIPTLSSGQNFERTIVVDVSSTTTSGTGEDPLTSITIPSGTFTADGQRLKIVADGNFNGVAGNKRLVMRFDTTTDVFDTGLVAIHNSNWHMDIQALRVSAGLLITCRFTTNAFGATSVPVSYGAVGFIAAPNYGNAHTFDFLGEVANAADSVSQGACIASLL
jgi:hypothetical protein